MVGDANYSPANYITLVAPQVTFGGTSLTALLSSLIEATCGIGLVIMELSARSGSLHAMSVVIVFYISLVLRVA